MTTFHDRRTGQLIKLSVEHPDIQDTYHSNVEAAHSAAGAQGNTYAPEGATYRIHAWNVDKQQHDPVWVGDTRRTAPDMRGWGGPKH